MRIVMMGTGTFAEPTFEALLAAFPESVIGLFTQPEREGVHPLRRQWVRYGHAQNAAFRPTQREYAVLQREVRGNERKNLRRHAEHPQIDLPQAEARLLPRCAGRRKRGFGRGAHGVGVFSGDGWPTYRFRLMRNSAFDLVFLSRWMNISIASTGGMPCIARRRP